MEIYVNVKNFGKIKEARVNISNFTIFVGNNNSGKTQLMELIYTVIKQLSVQTPDIPVSQMEDADAFRVGKDEIKKLNEWVNQYLSENIHDIIDKAFNVPIPIESITLEFEQIDSAYEIYYLTDKTVEYVLQKKLAPRKMLAEMLTEVVVNQKNTYGVLVQKLGVDGKEGGFVRAWLSKTITKALVKQIELGNILRELLGVSSRGSSNILFLPASRMGLMLLYKHYFGNTAQDKDGMIREKNQNSKGITQPVLDFLSFLLKYSYSDQIAKNNAELTDFIFAHLIDGKIDEKGDMTIYTPNDMKQGIPVFAASSMVNEVVPVIKALTDSDDINFLLYDEVETSMHPLKQTEMVRLLNRLNNKGFRLLVSTHSDTMATKINNLLLMSQGNFQEIKEKLKKNNVQIEEDDLLHSTNVHVYQFVNETDGKSTVEELEFRKVPGTGYDFSLFNDSAIDLFEEARAVMGLNHED